MHTVQMSFNCSPRKGDECHFTNQYILQDWTTAGLHQPSAFRSYVVTIAASSVRRAGRLSDRDWDGVRKVFVTATAVA